MIFVNILIWKHFTNNYFIYKMFWVLISLLISVGFESFVIQIVWGVVETSQTVGKSDKSNSSDKKQLIFSSLLTVWGFLL